MNMKTGAPCAFCGKWVERSKYIHRGRLEFARQRKYLQARKSDYISANAFRGRQAHLE